MNVLITQYPVTRTYLDGLTAAIGQPLRPIVVSTITARGYLEILKAFRRIKADSIYLPGLDSSGWPLVPPLEVLSMLAPVNRRFVIDPDRRIRPFGIFEVMQGVARIALGSLHGAAVVVWEWSRLRRLLRMPRLAPAASFTATTLA